MSSAPTLAPRPSSRTNGQNMVAIASGKGGVGKTWLAITLSHALAQQKLRTLLFDGDLGLANLDIQLGLMPKHDLGSVIAGRLSLSDISITSSVAEGINPINPVSLARLIMPYTYTDTNGSINRTSQNTNIIEALI